MRQQAGLAATLGLAGTMVAGAGALHDARPPVAHTGGFGEPTCVECHFESAPRTGDALSLGGMPERYEPGAAYALTVVLTDTGARAGGFQLAARVAAGPYAGAPAGTLCAASARVAIETDTATGVQYASHAGAAPADSLRWALTWRAPEQDVGPIVVHVAANAANDDDSPLGDVILLGSWETRGSPITQDPPAPTKAGTARPAPDRPPRCQR